MATSLLACTRKGLFVIEPHAGAWRIAKRAFLGDTNCMNYMSGKDKTRDLFA